MNSSPQRVLLTDDIVASLPSPEAGEARVWDTDLIGFCVRLHPSGRRTFCLKARESGRSIWKTIGVFGAPWSTADARCSARALLGIAQPTPRPSSPARHISSIRGGSDLTVSELIDIYLELGPGTNLTKRASSWRIDASNLNRHVRPLLGARIATSINADDITKTCAAVRDGATALTERTGPKGLARVRGGPGAAAITFRILKAMLQWAVNREYLASNPASGIRYPRQPLRERILTKSEARRLMQVLDEAEQAENIPSSHADLLRLLLFTGARRMEIMGLRWSEVDLDRARLVLPPERSKTGNRTGERRIALPPPAIAILSRRPRESSFVFPALRGSVGHTTGLQKSWDHVRKRSGLDGMRVHDLRHSFASFALEAGENILAISAALGHASTQMTERYLHLRSGAAASLAVRTSSYILS